jgi:hypothetical protein
MKTLALILLIVVLSSPLWASGLVALLPRRRLAWAFGICAVQGTLAYLVWWFYWGGGIGAEAHLPEMWQGALVFACLPVVVAVFRFWQRSGNAEPCVPPNGGPGTPVGKPSGIEGPPSVS